MAEIVTLARPYAKAAFSTAVDDNALAAWSTALGVLAQIIQVPKVINLIDSPSLTASEKSSALKDICSDEIDTKQASLVDVLAENGRLALLGEISALFDAYRAAHEKTVEVDVQTAFDLSDAQLTSLKASLKKTLARDVSIASSVDESLLGGIFIRAGDTVIDASVRGRLDKLASAIGA